MHRPEMAIEEQLGIMIVDGQRTEISVRSEPDDDGTWHNALIFRRASKLAGSEPLVTGLEWHVPPGIALRRAQELAEKDQLELFYRALRPRTPLM
jgi:hypothetical protein